MFAITFTYRFGDVIMFRTRLAPCLNWLKNSLFADRPDDELISYSSTISLVATVAAAVLFFWDHTRSSSESVPWLGILLLVGSFASLVVRGMIFLEKKNDGKRTGTWAAFLVMAATFALVLGPSLVLLSKI